MNKYSSNGFNDTPSMKEPTTHVLGSTGVLNGYGSVWCPWTPPTMVYWNVRDTTGYPVQSHTPNTQMLSGFQCHYLDWF